MAGLRSELQLRPGTLTFREVQQRRLDEAGYMRTLRFIDQPASAEVLAILANKLEYYAGEIRRTGRRADMAAQFSVLAEQTRTALDQLARDRWAEAGRMAYGA